ncbi:hypothetical protein GIB67_019922 [Kingdonia uniflora]|uniref:WPP domain-containing protein n=1 Tax=Kingdonia uniflora TaxID=39325 RepID=A0A7J7MKI5_9MAGN|nr:hypothetical protein GIB67_019922 [Kingdonia uniflora]
MAEESTQTLNPEITKKIEKLSVSFSIWPPTQRTRDAVTQRLIETLSTPSILSKRYGSIPTDEASFAARLIENEAFAFASSSSNTQNDGVSEEEGIEILQVYSKEISKKMLETVKARANDGSGTPIAEATNSEDVSSVDESESAA